MFWSLSLNATVSNLGATSNTWWTDSGRPNGAWFYVVTALNASGESGPSNCESVSVAIPVIPPNPPKLSVFKPDLIKNGSVGFNWTEVPGALYYTVYRSNRFITTLNSTVTTLGSTSNRWWTDSERSNGTWYCAVTVITENGESEPSGCIAINVAISSVATNPPNIYSILWAYLPYLLFAGICTSTGAGTYVNYQKRSAKRSIIGAMILHDQGLSVCEYYSPRLVSSRSN